MSDTCRMAIENFAPSEGPDTPGESAEEALLQRLRTLCALLAIVRHNLGAGPAVQS